MVHHCSFATTLCDTMTTTIIPTFGTIKLNSFRPLCGTTLGLEAIDKYSLPPFIDASCRREPDFQNPYPSISALCRKGHFAPHLRKDDIIVYMTIGGQIQPYKQGHHLVAILQVEEVYKTHEIGKLEYLNANLPIPSNCMVIENQPLDFDKTAGDFLNKSQIKAYSSRTEAQKLQIGKIRLKNWDNDYLNRSRIWQCFVKTKPLYLDFDNPTPILYSDFDFIFGKVPSTQTPKKLTDTQFIELAKLAGLDIKLGEKREDSHYIPNQ